MKRNFDKFIARLAAPPGKAHFIGIGGIGMAGVAYLLKQRGWEVSGCDAVESPMTQWLTTQGIPVAIGHTPAHAAALDPERDIVVRTPAVALSSIEVAEARHRQINTFDRGVVLAALCEQQDTIAICGTHGKTTTSCLVAGILRNLAPEYTAWCIGGVSPILGTVAGGERLSAPEHRRTLIVEADESDGTLALYAPKITVLTNLDLDHLEHFRDAEDFEASFRAALSKTTDCIVYCADHSRAAEIATSGFAAKTVSYGLHANADYRILNSRTTELGCSFMLAKSGEAAADITLSIPGRHNILNAAASIAAACESGISFKDACDALVKTAALPARRFERIGNPKDFVVISDYSHHPVEIAALIETAQNLPRQRIVAVFEPHRYTRTKILLSNFPKAFVGIDHLVLCPVYAASENVICGGTAADLYAEFRTQAADHVQIPIPVLAKSLTAATDYIRAILQPGDLVLVIGAGTINTIAPDLAAATPVDTLPQELRLGAFGTPTIAPRLKIARTMEELQRITKADEFHVIGSGTNTFVLPTGCHHTVIRLAGSHFDYATIREETNADAEIEVGAARQGPGFLRFCSEHGYSGLEYMTGIPGVCGDWLAMNAGTRFGAFCDAVTSVDVVAPDGTVKTIDAADLNASYRSCPGIKGHAAVRIRLRLRKSTPELVRRAMDEALAHRMDFSGLRTGGSVFKNPGTPLPPSGMILDQAGCKGLTIGGAYVTQRHANVIAAEQDATASDVYALMRMMRERAFDASGIRLEPEIHVLD